MNINPVSFRAQSPSSSFNAMLTMPQAFTTKESTDAIAATNISGAKKKSPIKKILLGALVAAGAAAGLAVGANKGWFNEGQNQILNKIKKPLKTVGEAISNFATQTVKPKLDNLISSVREKLAEAKKPPVEGA